MPCHEYTIQCPEASVSYLSERLWGLDAFSSVMEDMVDEKPVGIRAYSQDLRVNPEAAEHAQQALDALLHEDRVLDPFSFKVTQVRLVEDEEWAESWKRFWHVQAITERLIICPSWETEVPDTTGKVMIVLDPGSAFGTGTHPTTRLMLRAMEDLADRVDFAQAGVLDVGTGSGILAIYAAKLGSRTVMAIDIDPLAEPAVVDNIARNHVEDVVSFTTTPIGELCRTRYEVVLVNIIAPVILEIMDDVLLRLAPGGVLLLSGLIESSVPVVSEALSSKGLTEIQTQQQGDWFALQAQAPR